MISRSRSRPKKSIASSGESSNDARPLNGDSGRSIEPFGGLIASRPSAPTADELRASRRTAPAAARPRRPHADARTPARGGSDPAESPTSGRSGAGRRAAGGAGVAGSSRPSRSRRTGSGFAAAWPSARPARGSPPALAPDSRCSRPRDDKALPGPLGRLVDLPVQLENHGPPLERELGRVGVGQVDRGAGAVGADVAELASMRAGREVRNDVELLSRLGKCALEREVVAGGHDQLVGRSGRS